MSAPPSPSAASPLDDPSSRHVAVSTDEEEQHQHGEAEGQGATQTHATSDDIELEDVDMAATTPAVPVEAATPAVDIHPSSPTPAPTPTSAALRPPSTSPSISSSTATDDAPPLKAAITYGIALVGFDHQLGPTIEFTHPPELKSSEELTQNLPFLALPDGAHARDEDYSYFHMLLPSIAKDTIFGISCNRQIPADELINKGKEVTRSTVQKAIVVLASKPIFGPLREKLGVITRAYFAQKDFEDKSILVDLYSSLDIPSDASLVGGTGAGGLRGEEEEEEGGMYMGTSLRELVRKFRFKTLMLLKLIMLQRKVMFYAAHSSVEQLCTFQYSLVALIPALLTNLEDAASPTLDTRSKNTHRPTSLRTSDKQSLLRYLGLPLNIFGAGSFFQPYLPLQQIDLLQTRSYLVGTTNSIFQQQRDCKIDVIVNLDTASLEILNPRLVPYITLTAADRKWMDEIVTTVDSSWNERDPSRPTGLNFVGSDDFLRAKFEEYICSLLACIKFKEFLAKGERGDVLISGGDLDSNMMSAFNEGFIKAFQATPAFATWDSSTDSVIFDLVEPRHPMDGKTNAIEDVGIRLAHGLHSLHLEENLAAPAREAITKGFATGSDSIWKTYSFLRSDLSKRQMEFRERREGKEGKEGKEKGEGMMDPTPMITNAVFTGVDVAKTGAASIATGIGSFLSARRTQLFQATSGESTTSNPNSTSSSRRNSSLAVDPTSNSITSSSPSPSTTSGPSFLRPLSTSSLASISSTASLSPNTNTPPPLAGLTNAAGGFFNSLRRSFSETTVPAVVTPPEVGAGTTKIESVRRTRAEDEEVNVRDLDAEYEAAKRVGSMGGKEKEGGGEEDEFEVVPRDPLGLHEVTERPPSGEYGHEREGLLGRS